MTGGGISVIGVGGILLVAVPPDPDDATVAELQDAVLLAMEKTGTRGLVLDISTVETVDSFFARTVSETVQMIALMGGVTVLSGMRAAVAITTTQLGLTLGDSMTALDVDLALSRLRHVLAEQDDP
jgi:rsbT antagonist protein RsbS